MDTTALLAAAATALALVLAYYFMFGGKAAPPLEESEPAPEPAPAPKPSKKQKQQQPKKKKAGPAHALKHYSAKAHAGSITSVSFARNGQVLATSGADRQMKLFTGLEGGAAAVKQQAVKVMSQTKTGVEYADTISCAAIAARYLLVATEGNSLKGHFLPDIIGPKAVGLKDSTRTVECTDAHDVGKTIQSVALAPKGNFMISCTNETEIRLFAFPPVGPKASPVCTINTNQTKNHQLRLSPDGKFFACATFASEVKVWRVELGASRTGAGGDGAPTGATKAAVLTGHKRCVWSLDFSSDSSKCVTASKDGTWRLYDMREGIYLGKCIAEGSSPLGEITRIALSSDGGVLAAVIGTTIQFIRTADNEVLDTIEHAHSLTVTGLEFSPDGKLLASVSDDMFLRVWKAPAVV